MDRQRKERIVDDVLNRALGPQAVEPRDGFEGRILAKLAAIPQRRAWWRWVWVPALAAAAALAIAIGMRMMQNETAKPIEAKKTVETPTREAVANPTPEHPPRIAPVIARHPRSRATSTPTVIAAAGSLPRQDVFPAPVPLTEQERLMLALVNRQPIQAKVVADEQQAERERVQKFIETGEAPAAQPTPAQNMR